METKSRYFNLDNYDGEFDPKEIFEYVRTLHEINNHNESIIKELGEHIQKLTSQLDHYKQKEKVPIQKNSVEPLKDLTNLSCQNPEERYVPEDKMDTGRFNEVNEEEVTKCKSTSY